MVASVGAISPLFANVYMRRFVKGWKTGGHESRVDARNIRHEDDSRIRRSGTAEEAMSGMRTMMSKLKLTVNEQKTRFCRLPESRLIFWVTPSVGTTTAETGESYSGRRPSQKKVDRLCSEINGLTTTRKAWRNVSPLCFARFPWLS